MEEAFGYRPWFDGANNCTLFASRYHVSIAELVEWNPSLSKDDCKFGLEYSYCVVKTQPNTSTLAPTPPPSPTKSTDDSSSTTSIEIPENTQPGTIESCKKFHKVAEDDGACDGIIAKYNLNRADFYEWNPNVGKDCTTLWLGYYVCVGV